MKNGHSLVIEATAAAGGVSIFGEAAGQIPVQHIRHGPWDAFPGQNDDDDDGIGTVMAGALSDQAQQLFCLIAATDHLTESTARCYFRDELNLKDLSFCLYVRFKFFMGNAFTRAAYPFSDRTSLRALALSTRVHHLFQTDGVTLQSGPTQEKRKRLQTSG